MTLFRSRLAAAFIPALLLAACDDGSPSPSPTPSPAPTPSPVNAAPTFSSSGAVSTPENSAAAFYTAAATDPEGAAITYSIAGGADASQFQIGSSGALTFISPPSFSAPTDSDGNNVYLVTIGASDGVNTAQLPLQVTVTDRVVTSLQPRVQSKGFAAPVQVISVPNLRGRSNYVIQRTGIVSLQREDGSIVTDLDLSSSISTDGERGLLGAALPIGGQPVTSPSGSVSYVDFLYLFLTNKGGDLEVRRYTVNLGYPAMVDPASAKLIIRIPHASSNSNNGGWIEFGPDGYLYLGTGDGGGSGGPVTTAQDPASLLGKVLRLDVLSDAYPDDPDRNYAIPAGNPFNGSNGAPEVWALGLHNPDSGSFSPYGANVNPNHLAYVADHGSGREEINIVSPVTAGLNYGWPYFDGSVAAQTPAPGTAVTAPVTEYAHGSGIREGASVVVGPVFAAGNGDLHGQLIFADRSTGSVWSLPASSLVLGKTVSSANFILRKKDFTPAAGELGPVVSFYEIFEGNLKLLDAHGTLFDLAP